MWFIGVEVEQETSAPPPKKILDPPLQFTSTTSIGTSRSHDATGTRAFKKKKQKQKPISLIGFAVSFQLGGKMVVFSQNRFSARYVRASLARSARARLDFCRSPGGGGVLLCMGYIGVCRCEGYGFQAVYSGIGYINRSVWV